MKRLPAVILFVLSALSLVMSVTGCRGAQRYDSRLVAADSLMQRFPDSALAVVEGCDGLTAEADLAYRALLLTQARYKSYIQSTSDSAINRALAYYRAHPKEREKLTRAYIYKGAVMEELDNPDSAMLYYKHAEATADPDDYFNLGYIKMRMGALYRDHYSMDGKHIEKYEEALKYIKLSGDTQYLLKCMINLGGLYRLKKPELSESTLMEAKDLASQLKDTISYVKTLQNLMQTLYYQKKYNAAYVLAKEVMTFPSVGDNHEFYANAAEVFAKLGKPDSAELLLKKIPRERLNNVIEEIMYLEGMGEIALARGDTSTYKKLTAECMRKDDSLQMLDSSIKIMKVEASQEEDARQHISEKHQLTSNRLIFAVILSVLALLFFGLYDYRKTHKYDRLIKELRSESDSHTSDLEDLQKKLVELDIRDTRLKHCLDFNIEIFREVMEECYRMPDDRLVKKLKRIIQFKEQNKVEWTKLYDYLDMRYNDIMADTRKNHPQLDERDLLLLALSVLDFSCAQIALVMGYTNPTSVGVIRQRLAKKMRLQGTLRQYIEPYCAG